MANQIHVELPKPSKTRSTTLKVSLQSTTVHPQDVKVVMGRKSGAAPTHSTDLDATDLLTATLDEAASGTFKTISGGWFTSMNLGTVAPLSGLNAGDHLWVGFQHQADSGNVLQAVAGPFTVAP